MSSVAPEVSTVHSPQRPSLEKFVGRQKVRRRLYTKIICIMNVCKEYSMNVRVVLQALLLMMTRQLSELKTAE